MKKLITIICLIAVSLLITSCGPGQVFGPSPTLTPTFTPVPTATLVPTLTPTPTLSPTPTAIPGGLIVGRVTFAKSDQPVQTYLYLELDDKDRTDLTSTETDENGYYSFLIEEPGSYYVNVSVMGLVNSCKNLRADPIDGWNEMFEHYYGDILVELSINTSPISVVVGEKIKLDCKIYCD